jgi:hypothetical protein
MMTKADPEDEISPEEFDLFAAHMKLLPRCGTVIDKSEYAASLSEIFASTDLRYGAMRYCDQLWFEAFPDRVLRLRAPVQVERELFGQHTAAIISDHRGVPLDIRRELILKLFRPAAFDSNGLIKREFDTDNAAIAVLRALEDEPVTDKVSGFFLSPRG